MNLTENSNTKNPLQNITLKMILEDFEDTLGFEYLAEHVQVRCFMFDPTITSALKFLRKTPWAREKVEKLWVKNFTE
ncbi:TPA: DUF2132 domain-containing protein [Candidatus Gracilibacteria bacterium]|jgi:uncharacterized protein (DUF2132 family)|nr:DUF2132 domain-containing protein [Candidatus Peregrinibacteria bacterium]HIQ56672.1 DUF2132 domain-containing protein [Candidatus Gracilibacteria bacterium]HIQ57132.1 DUF2132 domain-containing protein [Candidatus Gracilibacteria bacterium]